MSQISSKSVQRFWEKLKMCLNKIVNYNCKYRSQRHNLNKLEIKSPWDSPNQIWMISGQRFYRGDFLRICQKLHKITHNSMNNRGRTPTLTNLLEGHPRNIQIWSKSVQWFKRRNRKTKKVHADDNDNNEDGHRVIARVTLTHWVWLKRYSITAEDVKIHISKILKVNVFSNPLLERN